MSKIKDNIRKAHSNWTEWQVGRCVKWIEKKNYYDRQGRQRKITDKMYLDAIWK